MPLVPSLAGPGVKMSSSVQGSNIKVNASIEEIKKTIRGAYCPVGVVEDNPIVEIANLLILPNEGSIVISRDNKFGGDIEISSVEELRKLFEEKKLHPADLKSYVADYLINKLKRARDYFDGNKDLLEQLGPKFQ